MIRKWKGIFYEASLDQRRIADTEKVNGAFAEQKWITDTYIKLYHHVTI